MAEHTEPLLKTSMEAPTCQMPSCSAPATWISRVWLDDDFEMAAAGLACHEHQLELARRLLREVAPTEKSRKKHGIGANKLASDPYRGAGVWRPYIREEFWDMW